VRFVVKLGGAGLENPKLLHAAGKAIAELVADGNQVAVVHGGGVQLTRTLEQLGKKSQFISGLRVTDAETMDMFFARARRRQTPTSASSARLPRQTHAGWRPFGRWAQFR
jgi:acetylglutamate kinase